MASDVEIANQALTLLGDSTIAALTEDSNRARIANQFYGPTRDAVLRSHPWNCAIFRQALAPLSAKPVFGWSTQFALPSDPYCLRVLALNDDEECGSVGDVFKVEGRNLLTNTSSANIRGIQRITDPNQYDAMLYEAFAARLAWKMAYPLTNKTNLAVSMFQLYKDILQEARSIDGQEGSPDAPEPSILLSVR